MIEPARILDDELRGTDAVTRAYARENSRLRRLVVELCVELLRHQPKAVTVAPTPAAAIDETVDTTDAAMLKATVEGALKMTIQAHGPISFAYLPSAAKRICGAVNVYNHNVRQKTSLRK